MNSLGQALPAAGGRAGSPSRRSFNVGNLNRPRSLQLAPIYPPNTGPSASNFERDLSLDIPAEIEQFALRMDWIGQVKYRRNHNTNYRRFNRIQSVQLNIWIGRSRLAFVEAFA